MKGFICLAGSLALLICGQALAGDGYLAQFDVPADAEYVGSEDCMMCHEEVGEFYTHSPHHWERGLVVPGTAVAGCEACHGPASLHAEGFGEGWVLGAEQLGSLDPAGRAQMCTQCHTSMDLHFADGPHADTEVSCADCHADQAHSGGAARPAKEYRNQAEFCLQCHTEVVPEFRLPSRHRVLEGHLGCNDCHDPHAAVDTGDWDDLNATCLKCHTQVAGPFVFEHAGVEGEECLTCHRPHGSQHEKMLVQSGNGLCLQCHFEQAFSGDDSWTLGNQAHQGLLTGEARCYDCHREIHGSNVDPTFYDR